MALDQLEFAAGFRIYDNWLTPYELANGRIFYGRRVNHKWIIRSQLRALHHFVDGWDREAELFTRHSFDTLMPQPKGEELHEDQMDLSFTGEVERLTTQISVTGLTEHLTAHRFVGIDSKIYLLTEVDVDGDSIRIYPHLQADSSSGSIGVRPNIGLVKPPEFFNSMQINSRGFSLPEVTFHERI